MGLLICIKFTLENNLAVTWMRRLETGFLNWQKDGQRLTKPAAKFHSNDLDTD